MLYKYKMSIVMAVLSMSLYCIGVENMMVEYGVINMNDCRNCSITSNGVVYKQKGDDVKVPGLWFGLIKYNCINCIGTIISVPECRPCGVFCVYNELIPKCNQKVLPTILGATLGILMFAAISYLIYKSMGTVIKKCYNEFVYRYYKRKDNKIYKHAKYNIRSGQLINGINMPDVRMHLDDEYKEKINKSRSKVVYKNESNQIYMFTKFQQKFNKNVDCGNDSNHNNKELDAKCKDQPISKQIASAPSESYINNGVYEELTDNYADPKPSTSNQQCKSSGMDSYGNKHLIIYTLLCILVIVKPVEMCDNTLFIQSDGKVCDSNGECQSSTTYQFSLTTGQDTCFSTAAGQTLSFKLTETYLVTTYYALYMTSDFNITTDSYWNCNGVGECWTDNCYKGKVGDQFVTMYNTTTGTNVIDFDCEEESLGCEKGCFYHSSCTFYYWEIQPVKDTAMVYKKTDEYWEAAINVCMDEICEKRYVNANNPATNLNSILSEAIKKLYNDTKFPLIVTSHISGHELIEDYIINDNGLIKQTKACDLNYPVEGLIGDFQISLNRQTSNYPRNSVNCRTNGCKPKCTTSKSGLAKFRTMKHPSRRMNIKLANNHQVIIKTNNKPTVQLMIGKVNILNLKVETANCDINQISSYGCIGCNTSPYVILKAFNIIRPGLLPFVSNCTFDTNFITCNKDPYALIVNDFTTICSLHLTSLNKTIHINTSYEYVGIIDPSLMYESYENTGDIVKRAMSSQSFIDSISWTFGACVAFTSILTIIIRIIGIYNLNKAQRSINNINGNPNT